MPKIKVVINPISGRGSGGRSLPEIEAFLKAKGMQYSISTTTHPEHAIELAQKAAEEGYDIVAAVGGDGTVNEVINGLMRAGDDAEGRPALAVIPVGRGNDFAYGANLLMDIQAGCENLAQGRPRSIDIGLISGGDYPEGRYFGNGIGIGFDTVVGFEAAKIKRLHGFPNYLVAALKTLMLYYTAPKVFLDFGDHRKELDALMISVMNGRRMGGGFMMAPEASMADGVLDMCMVHQVTRMQILALIPRFMQGNQFSHPAVETAQFRTLKVSALNGTLPIHADGETICTNGKNAEIELLPQQLYIITPQERPN